MISRSLILQAAKIMRRFFYEAPAEIMRIYTTSLNEEAWQHCELDRRSTNIPPSSSFKPRLRIRVEKDLVKKPGRERERERQTDSVSVHVCERYAQCGRVRNKNRVCVSVCERKRVRKKERERECVSE